MLFVLFKIVWLFFQPVSLLVLLGLGGLPLAWSRRYARRRAGLGLVSASLGGFALILLLPLGQWLLLPLEDRFPLPVDPPAKVDGIILLGGAEALELSEARGVPSFNDTMATVTTFIALARRYPQARLAFSGGSGNLLGNRISEADDVRALFAQLGFDRTVIYESRSRDTYQNATMAKQIVQPAPGETWLLVTSAAHMPRSVGCFRAVGWPVAAWPAAFASADVLDVQLREGVAGRLSDLENALHEWVGLVAYRLLGRTTSLFPGPKVSP